MTQSPITPIAMGEISNSPHERTALITGRPIDYIRIHVSQAPAMSRQSLIAPRSPSSKAPEDKHQRIVWGQFTAMRVAAGFPAFSYYGRVAKNAGPTLPPAGERVTPSISEVLQQILQVQTTLHGAGTVSAHALSAIAAHASTRPIRNSAETGCGATTLLLSHLSQNHTVFALDIGNSVSSVRRSALLGPRVVTFVEGPSQRTLPKHHFPEKLQLALIDGPHAYPFPDLEYYFLYPHLDAGALLILDDIQIRSIHNLFEFLRADSMFQLEEVVRSTAFFIRTEAPTFDPTGDRWQEQRYNARTLMRYDWRSRLKSAFPDSTIRRIESFRRRVTHASSGCSVEIHSPHRGDRISEGGTVAGTAHLAGDTHLWVLVHRRDVDGWWPQGAGEIAVSGSQWSVQVKYGGPEDAGYDFEIAAVIVGRPAHEQWMEWVRSVQATRAYPPVQLPGAGAVLSAQYRTVTKG